jgi:hypothetical protein
MSLPGAPIERERERETREPTQTKQKNKLTLKHKINKIKKIK